MKSALLRLTCLLLPLLAMSCEKTDTVELLVAAGAAEEADPVHGWPTVFINENASPTAGVSAVFTKETRGVTVTSLTGGSTEGQPYQVTPEFVGSARGLDPRAMKIGRKESPRELNWKEVFSGGISYEGTEEGVHRGSHIIKFEIHLAAPFL